MSARVLAKGCITCAPEESEMIAELFVEHARLSRAEAGCIRFDYAFSADGCTITVDEIFRDRTAFEEHGRRTRSSAWWPASEHLQRDITVTEE